MSRPAPAAAAPVGALAALTCASAAASGGNPAVAAAPPLAAAGLFAAWRAPRALTLALLALGLLVDSPQENPGGGLWQSPLYPLGQLLFENLNKLTGVGALRFAGVDLAVFALLPAMLARPRQGPATPGMTRALLVALATVVAQELHGLANGGDFKNSLWQVHQPAFLPLLTLLFMAALRPGDHVRLGVLLLVTAVYHAGTTLYFRLAYCAPRGLNPNYAGTHSDSVLYAAAVLAALTLWHERRTWGSALLCAVAVPLVAVGMVHNQRRLVWVALVAALAVLFAVVPRSALKRALVTGTVLALPLLLMYAAMGWSAQASVFRPVQIAKQVLTSKGDSSAQTRDIENYNLTRTLKMAPLLGQGFGREYVELVKADDISVFFPQYRFIPHNSLLGLWAFGGVVGFSLFWTPLVVGAYLAARAYRHARGSVDRAAALTALGVLAVYGIQCWGDMGLQSWLATVLVAAALAVAANLAAAVEPAAPSRRATEAER